MASVGPMDEKVDVAKTFTNDAIQKYINFATPNAESELWAHRTLFVKNMQKLDCGALQRPPVPKVYKTKSLVRGRNGHEEERSRSDTKFCLLGQLQLATFIENPYDIFTMQVFGDDRNRARNHGFIHFPYVLCMPLAASSRNGTVEKTPWWCLKYSQ